jgi:hypothetical protein
MSAAPRFAVVVAAALAMVCVGGCVGPCSTPIVLLPIGWLLDGKPCTGSSPSSAMRPVVGKEGLPVTEVQIDRREETEERDHP